MLKTTLKTFVVLSWVIKKISAASLKIMILCKCIIVEILKSLI